MFYKYFKLILFFSVLIQASPKLFNDYGNKMESFQKDCKIYQKTPSLPTKIKKKCKVYILKTNQAFKYGYKLDPKVGSDNLDIDEADRYYKYLYEQEENKESILSLIRLEMKKARKEKNIEYYKLLVDLNQTKIYLVDYNFMKMYVKQFSEHPKCIKFEKELKDKEILKNAQKKKRLKEALENNKQKASKKKNKLISSKYRGIDSAAYNAYINSREYKNRERMATAEPIINLEASYQQGSNIINWKAVIKSLDEQTGSWASLSAAAKGYHSDFLYAILSLSLRDKNNKEVYLSPGVKRKIYVNRRNNVHHSTVYPEGLVFSSATISFGLDLSGSTYAKRMSEKRKDKTINRQSASLLSKVDLVSCYGLEKDNLLSVSFIYKNRDIDRQLPWKNDKVLITCKVYGDAGDFMKHFKGSLIGQISNKIVTRSFQDIYIDLRNTSYDHGILECSLNIHGRIFKANHTFLMR